MRYPFFGAFLTAVAGLAAAQTPSGPVTFERIQNANREPQNWLTYSGNNMGQRYSSLMQVTPQNVTSRIDAGVMIGCGPQAREAAEIGRKHKGRKLPW